jgi:hypothetical protein
MNTTGIAKREKKMQNKLNREQTTKMKWTT